MRYSPKERFIAHFLSSFPALKQKIKYAYQQLNYWRFKKDYLFITPNKLIRIANKQKDSSFFGYYDRSPMSKDGQYIIFHSTTANTRNKPEKTVELDLMLYNMSTQQTQKFATTKAFNWQQGSKLQWLSDNEIIYNDYTVKSDSYVSRIFHCETKKLKTIDVPIYDVYNDYGLSLNFDRLTDLRPDYGYFAKKPHNTSFQLQNEGVIYVDLKTNKAHLLLSLEGIIKSHYRSDMEDANHLVNHIMISPCGSQFMFLHRWFKKGVRYDALMLCDKDGENLTCLADNGMVSHCFWKSDDEIVAYLQDEKLGVGYFLIHIPTGKRKSILNLSHLGDGHPHVYGDRMLIDTYPNKARMKELLTYDFNTEQISKVGEFFESLHFYGESRCDLHPRFSPDGKAIFIDSVHEGKRHLYMIEK